MESNSQFRLPVDFGNCDADGAVRLVTRGTVEAMAEAKIQLKEGMQILMTDDEINAIGKISMRDGMWVAIITEWLDK